MRIPELDNPEFEPGREAFLAGLLAHYGRACLTMNNQIISRFTRPRYRRD